MSTSRRDVLKLGAAAAVFTNCGYLLYPERKGRSAGSIDTGVFIVDLVWLLPGIIPGVICLAVDFTTGCIYRSGRVAQQEPPPNTDATVAVKDAIVAKSEQTEQDLRLVWAQKVDHEAVKQHGELIFRRAGGAIAKAKVRDLI